MTKKEIRLSKTFKNFFNDQKSGGIVLIIATLIALLITNFLAGNAYGDFWQKNYIGGLSIEHWVNDGLMAVFFLLIGLELERELYIGELSDFKNALLPIFAAIGGLGIPALIHLSMNYGLPTQAGIGIPMATDIAFALGVLALLGSRVPASLKVFVVAYAVIDDLCAIIIIAVFYTAKLSVAYLLGALAVWGLLIVLNRLRIMSLIPYILGGVLMWYLMLKSGVHATIAGVLLAFAIPFATKVDDETSLSYKLENFLHKPVAFLILPIFALANTGIVIGADALQTLANNNEMGIIGGLLIGKVIGISLFSLLAIVLKVSSLPLDLNWKHIVGAGFLGGIGFTMSIFITNLAFVGNSEIINSSKMAILVASLTAGIIGFIWLMLFGEPTALDTDPETMDIDE